MKDKKKQEEIFAKIAYVLTVILVISLDYIYNKYEDDYFEDEDDV
jgi:hypothetical protein